VAIPPARGLPPSAASGDPREDPRRPHHRLREASPAAASGDGEEKGGGREGGGGGGIRVPPPSRLEGTTRGGTTEFPYIWIHISSDIYFGTEVSLGSQLSCILGLIKVKLYKYLIKYLEKIINIYNIISIVLELS
jgi:hypothetical protein